MSETLRILLHNNETTSMANRLKSRFPDISVATSNSYADLPAAVANFQPNAVYSVRFDGTTRFPASALFECAALRWISNGGAGTDHLGVWDPTKITVTNAAGVAADMMAEYVLGGFLHFTLDVSGLQADKAGRIWRARQVVPLKGKTILIVGLGNTGQAIAKLASAFGMTVLGTRARPVAMDNVDEVHGAADLPKVLPRADFVAVSTPLTPKTKGLIGAAEIAAMKPGVVFADVSRGGVTDQTALLEGLSSGRVAGAILDVFETEPLPVESALWDVENVIISPHCSSVYDGWEDASFELFLNNLERWRAGAPLTNVVDPHRGY